MRVVIIGNGVAGIEAALAVREREPTWKVTIISEESDHFFSRTALMWVACGQMAHRDIEPTERDLYDRMGFVRIRARAMGIDAAAKQVELGGDLAPIPYDKLLLACGSKPRAPAWPGGELSGVGAFVTHQDLAWLQHEAYGRATFDSPPRLDAHVRHSAPDSPYRFRPVARESRGRPPREVAVIGGGLIGIEAVEVLLAAGHRPHFIIREKWYWPVALDEQESAWVSERLAAHGVRVHLEHEIKEILGDERGNVRAVATQNGDIPAELLVVAIGVEPNTAWLADSGLEIDERGGIVVDEGLGTSLSDVYAAGDCTSVLWFNGVRRPEQLWYTSRDQGRVAGRRLVGDGVSYRRGTFYNSAKLMDIEYTTAGAVNFGLAAESHWFYEERGRARSTVRIVSQHDQVVGFNMLGRRWDHGVLVRWIDERRSLAFVLDHLGEAAFDSELVPPMSIPTELRTAG